jgi:hypothetical protein
MEKRSGVLSFREPEKASGLGIFRPAPDDVVIRQRRGNPRVVYLLGTPKTPEQFSLATREEAVTKAVAFARKERVRAWFENGDKTFVLLGAFKDES